MTNTENMIPHLMGLQYLYLYDTAANPGLELKTDYLLVNQQKEMVLQLGMVKSNNKKVIEYHCNSFMVDYKENANYDLYFRNLTCCYEINKIIQEDKVSKRKKTIYQSPAAKEKEMAGIGKMILAAGMEPEEEIVKNFYKQWKPAV